MVFILLKVRRGKSSAYFVHQNFIGSMRPAKILGFKISRKPDRAKFYAEITSDGLILGVPIIPQYYVGDCPLRCGYVQP